MNATPHAPSSRRNRRASSGSSFRADVADHAANMVRGVFYTLPGRPGGRYVGTTPTGRIWLAPTDELFDAFCRVFDRREAAHSSLSARIASDAIRRLTFAIRRLTYVGYDAQLDDEISGHEIKSEHGPMFAQVRAALERLDREQGRDTFRDAIDRLGRACEVVQFDDGTALERLKKELYPVVVHVVASLERALLESKRSRPRPRRSPPKPERLALDTAARAALNERTARDAAALNERTARDAAALNERTARDAAAQRTHGTRRRGEPNGTAGRAANRHPMVTRTEAMTRSS